MTEYERICATRKAYKEAADVRRGWLVGKFVTSLSEMSDVGGRVFHVGEYGEIVKVTKSTIHVRDPRGMVHVRYRYFFHDDETRAILSGVVAGTEEVSA